MYTGNTSLKFDEVVSVGLTCLEQKIDSKAEVKERIITAVQNQFTVSSTTAKDVEELPLAVFALLYEKLGIGFEVDGGKIARISRNIPMMHVRSKGDRDTGYKKARYVNWHNNYDDVITLGKEYDIHREKDEWLYIQDDRGSYQYYRKHCFEILS